MTLFPNKLIPEERWFAMQQGLLLWMANSMYGRDLLCICKSFPKIVRITPNSITSRIGDKLFVTDFRTHSKWSKIIRYRWKEFQEYATFYYKQLPSRFRILFPVVPQMGFAYVSSTFYPAAGAASPVDGNVTYQGAGLESFASVRGAADGTAVDVTSANINAFCACSNFATAYDIERGVTCFDTSSIGAGATVTAAVDSIYVTDGRNEGTTTTFGPYSNSIASTADITTADYDQFGTTIFATAQNIPDHPGSPAYFDFTFNASGIAAISLTGVSKLAWRETTGDVGNTAPGAGNSHRIAADTADQTGTTSDPKLVVTYTPGVTSNFFLFMGPQPQV